MEHFSTSEPATPDYYHDLGLQKAATNEAIKGAFRKLAIRYHPDKQTPGLCPDTKEFRKVREAYEVLLDETKRSVYDLGYPDVLARWLRYREWQEDQRRAEEAKRDTEERERRRAEEEAAKRSAEAERARILAERERAAKERADRERLRAFKEKLAENRSREAARRAREAQEQVARERLQKQKEEEAELRSQKAIQRAREEQAQAAQARLTEQRLFEKQEKNWKTWTEMRSRAEQRQLRPVITEKVCLHPQFGWPRKKGSANCIFCGGLCAKFSFHCPLCDTVACFHCKNQYCTY